MNEWQSKISMILKHFKCTKAELEAKIGVGNGYIRDIETGKNKNPNKFIKGLVDCYGINPNWLIGNDNNMLLSTGSPSNTESSLMREFSNLIEANTSLKFQEQEERLAKVEARQEELDKIYREMYDLYYNTPKETKPKRVIRRSMGSKGIITEKQGILYPDGTFIEDSKLPEEVKEPAPLYTADYEEPEETEELPLAVNLAAGVPVEAADSGETYPVPKRFIKQNKKYCVAKINGTSMTEADIPDGSYVLLEYTDQPVNGKNMVVKYGSNTTLKLLHQTETGSWELLYCDGSGAKIELKDGDWEVKGKFITVLPKKR